MQTDLLMSSMGFESKIHSQTAHPTGNVTSREWKELEVPRNGAHVPRDGDFIQADGTHMKLSQGLPFVLAVNGGEVLLQTLEEFNVQLHQDTFPVIAYVQPGPNVSTLGAGAFFTLFICGRLFLVQVLRVLRQPDTREPVRIELLSPSVDGGAVGPESENVQAPCTGSKPFASAETPHHRLRTPESPVKARYSENALNSSPLSVQIPDCTLGEPSLPIQMPIPSRIIDPELLSPNYGWRRTTSPLPVMDSKPEHSVSSRRFTPHRDTEAAGKTFVCPLRTPDTPSRIRTDSLTAQHGSLLSHDTTTSIVQRVPKDHSKIHGIRPNVWPSSVLLPIGSGKNVIGRLNSEARLARIIGSKSPRPPERFSSLKPELDPVNDYEIGVFDSPLPAPIGTGRPVPIALHPIDQSLPSQDGVLPGAFGVQPVCPEVSPISRGVSSINLDGSPFSCMMEREDLPVVPIKDKDMGIPGPDATAIVQHTHQVASVPLWSFGNPFQVEQEDEDSPSDCLKCHTLQSPCSPSRCIVEKQCRLLLSLITS